MNLVDKIIKWYSLDKNIFLGTMFWIVFNIFMIPLIPIFSVIKYGFRIKLVKLHDTRIGHLAGTTEIFLRRLRIRNHSHRFYFIASKKPANNQLLKMYNRIINIYQYPKFINHRIMEVLLNSKSILSKFGFFLLRDNNNDDYIQLSEGEPILKFNKPEEKKGQLLLRKMGVKDKFICFYSRDKTYVLKHNFLIDKYKTDYRNANINNFLKATNYITSKGYFAIRMGASVENEIMDIENKKIIDYASNYRTDFGDIYLSANCKFFLGCNAGLIVVPLIFNIPVAITNVIPINFHPMNKKVLFIPKKIWSEEEKRLLTFKEIFQKGIYKFNRSEDFLKSKLKVIENTSKEILDLTIEMNEKLDGTWKSHKEDKLLQKKFKSIFKNADFNFKSRIGAKFLRDNKELLE